ncbi:probable WRKY transcription factor 30 [Neltuma alba]|uniref:probable WRKY transcription factor 30 n=1 Tax=Neltuma alba TaxID=207710 RepID=UPI0010A42021|nr:probable WRKY transcription factor 30 [Prosopis alba]
MEDSGAHDLINELLQGRDLARQLQMCVNAPSASPQTPDMLIRGIIAAFDNALALLNSPAAKHPTDSPPFSPLAQHSHKHIQLHEQNSLARWTKQIRISPGMAVESLLDDGFSWRKYGQKDILGAKFPRGYYRCTHRHTQGCLATKQVQRSDEDPAIMEVNYRGNHTCKLAPSTAPPSQEQLVNLRAGLRVLTENLNASDQTSFASFLLPSTSNVKPDSPDSTCPAVENNVETFSSSPYMSPASPAAANYSVSQGVVNTSAGPLNLPASTSDINNVVSPASAPAVASEFPFDRFEIEGRNFTFPNPGYF